MVLIPEGKRHPVGMWRLDGCILVGVSLIAGIVWSLGALALVSPRLNTCSAELGVVVSYASLDWALLRIVFYVIASWLVIVFIRGLVERYAFFWRGAFGLACVTLGVFVLTWGELSLYAQLIFDWGESVPRFGVRAIQCQGEESSLWPDWIPLPSPSK